MENEPWDLRRVLDEIKDDDSQYHETDVVVDPDAEISGVYRYIGAGGTTMRPTKEGPVMMFNNVKGFPDARVLIGLMASRKRVGKMFHQNYQTLGGYLNQSVSNPIWPEMVPEDQAPAHEIVHKATDKDFDIRKLVPAPTNTPEDAGPYITVGVVLGSNLNKTKSDVTIHRMVLEGKDKLGIYIMPGGRHIGAFADEFEKENKPMPITINIGLDPAITIGATFEPPTTPFGYNELGVAGSIRQQAVQLVNGLTVDEKAIARSEYTLEGYILPHERIQEDINTHTGKAMPEFPGYDGDANPALQVIKVTAVTHRQNPIMQSVIGPSEEHVSMAGIPTEASILQLVNRAIPGKVANVYNPPAGGGKLMTIMQIHKENEADEGIQRQAALLAFSAFKELKTVILVDEDVDIFDMNDVIWTINTRFQADQDIMVLPGMRNHPLDPSERPEYDPKSIRVRGMSSKLVIDGTVPFDMKDQFERAKFMEVPDWKKYLK